MGSGSAASVKAKDEKGASRNRLFGDIGRNRRMSFDQGYAVGLIERVLI